MVVVLPAPFAPRKPKIVPGAIVNDRSQTASVSPYDLLRRSRRMAGSLIGIYSGSSVGRARLSRAVRRACVNRCGSTESRPTKRLLRLQPQHYGIDVPSSNGKTGEA